MARLIVTTDNADRTTLMDEQVKPEHLDDQHSALQVLERLAWAIEDAHGQEKRRRASPRRRTARR